MKILNEIILKSTNASVINHHREQIGEVAEVVFGEDDITLRYLIMRTDRFNGYEDRYFAIPISPQLLNIAEDGTIIVNASQEDMQLAESIPANECASPGLEFGRSIYELYNYRISKTDTSGNGTLQSKKP